MHPDAGELFDFATGIHLPIEEVGDRRIVEDDRDARAVLPHQRHVFHVKQIVGRSNAESAHFRIAVIPQE